MIAWLKKHHIIHDWGRWSDPRIEEMPFYNQDTDEGDTANYDVQYRTCKYCGAWSRLTLYQHREEKHNEHLT